MKKEEEKPTEKETDGGDARIRRGRGFLQNASDLWLYISAHMSKVIL